MTMYVADDNGLSRVPHPPKDEIRRARYDDALRELAERYREKKKDQLHDLEDQPES